jgi:hypothetical protein
MIKTITQNVLAVLLVAVAAFFLYKLALEMWCIIYGLI